VSVCPLQVTGPLAATTEFDEPPGPVPPADASEEDLAALQAQSWAAASLSVAGIRVQGIKGRVVGYSSCSFRVEFTPRVAGERAVFRHMLVLQVSAPASANKGCCAQAAGVCAHMKHE
jgi:hypothetical protein